MDPGDGGPALRTPVVTILGLGEAGGRLAADLVAVGVEVHGYDPYTTSAPEGVAQDGDLYAAVSSSTVVLALTTASTALAAAESALPGLRNGAVYADLYRRQFREEGAPNPTISGA